MTEERSSYRQIFKATSLFGGVQVFQILTGIVRVKFVAVLLGASGVGIIGLLNSPLQMITSLTGFGIALSAVREISEAKASKDETILSRKIRTVRKWAWFTGLFGSVVTLGFAPLLSQWSFGDKEYTWAFVWLSITLLLQAISRSQSAVLQGMRRLKEMAKAGVIGSALGLTTSIPLYYFFGIDGIVPSLILSVTIGLVLNWYFARRVKIKKLNMSLSESFQSGIGMAKLGIFMTLAGFIASFSAYVLNAFISQRSGVEQVGLYNAGWGVVGQYTNLIFAAMATDYFPRLSGVQSDNRQVRELVGQQIETALLIMTPLLTLLIITMPLVIRVLYTAEFIPVVMFANLTVLGMQFKAISWAMGYVYLAKGNGKLFLTMEIIAGSVILAMNLFFYYMFGLNGLGVSFIISFFLSTIVSYLVLKKKYDFFLQRRLIILTIGMYLFAVVSFLSSIFADDLTKYSIGIAIFILSVLFSLNRLNQLMDLKSAISERLLKRRNK